MPYIEQHQRPQYDHALSQIDEIHSKGDLEYCIFWLMKKYMSTNQFKYSHLHDTTYAAAHCADEFRRRYLDKRENVALEQNGDI